MQHTSPEHLLQRYVIFIIFFFFVSIHYVTVYFGNSFWSRYRDESVNKETFMPKRKFHRNARDPHPRTVCCQNRITERKTSET